MTAKAVSCQDDVTLHHIPYLDSTGTPSLTYKTRKLKLESTYEREHKVVYCFYYEDNVTQYNLFQSHPFTCKFCNIIFKLLNRIL